MAEQAHQVFDQNEFYPAFKRDLNRASALVLISSPYLGGKRLDDLSACLDSSLQRGVRVCVFAQEPTGWKITNSPTAALKQFEAAVEFLNSLGVHVNLRKRIHEKIAVIDGQILWDGSLNMLSHYDSSELVNRWDDRVAAQRATRKFKLDSCDRCPSGWSTHLQASEEHNLVLIGECIQRRRVELGMSQTELAARCKISQSIISKVEMGKRNVHIQTLRQICAALELIMLPAPNHFLPSIMHSLRK